MFVWIGCKLPEEFEQSVRSVCFPLVQELGLDTSGFSLPQHISLKISFDAGQRHEEVLNALVALLQKECRFSVTPKEPERHNKILWIPFHPNPQLRQLHDLLDRELSNRFGIPQHPFDQDFRFHSTLCMGEEEKLRRIVEQLRELSLPASLEIQTVLLGVSENGGSGTYRVVREIHLF